MSTLLKVDRVSKVFPGQVALADVDLTITAGSTHALVGQNGSGKSTLIKVLCGYHQPTGPSSATYYGDPDQPEGRPLLLGNAKAAADAGIRFVHQDLGLVDGLSAAENIAMGVGYIRRRFGSIDWKATNERAAAGLAALDFTDINVGIPVALLAPAQKTAVAIARALEGWQEGANLLVLDEPTASLPGADVERLFSAIENLKERGVAILYVSHHLDEVFAIADEVTVLRDGERVDTVPTSDLDHDRLIELMIGHRLERRSQTKRNTDDSEAVLRVRGIGGATVATADLAVEPGEVVGVAGITGSGRDTIIPLITGQIPSERGSVLVGDRSLANYSPSSCLDSGMAFVAADRSTQGVIPLQSVCTNLTLSDVRRHWRGGRLRHKEEAVEAQGWAERLSVKAAGLEAPIASLSGGNQQKVLFGRSLRLAPRVLVLDEPTHGIDVGAKEDIHVLIDKAADEGAAVLVASTDTDELVRLAHRVLIMRGGTVAVELSGSEMTVENIEREQLRSDRQAEAV